MKFKALRRKDNKEFVHIQEINGLDMTFTCEFPKPMSVNLTLDELINFYTNINFSDYELILFEMIETN